MAQQLQLTLRPFTSESLLALIDSTDKFNRVFGIPAAGGLREFFVSGDVSQQFVEKVRSTIGEDPWNLGFAVIDEINHLVVGAGGLKGPPKEEGIAEIAYGIVPTFEGRGYATEVASMLMAFALQDPRVRIIRAHTLPTENASTQVLLKNGFEKLGEVIDPEDGLVWRWERPLIDNRLVQNGESEGF